MNKQRPLLFGLMPARAIPVTAILVGVVLFASLVGKVLDRTVGMGLSTLSFNREAIFNLQLWRLVTYPFVESTFWGLVLGLLILWIFGGWFETKYGPRDYLRFFFLSAVGAAIIAVPLSALISLFGLFQDVGAAEGPGAVIDAMLVAFALASPNANVLFGFVIPVRAKTIIFLILGLEVVRGIMSGAAVLSITLGGMAMGYLLVTGYWRPQRLWRSWRRKNKIKKRHFYVVKPPDDTLH